MTDGYYYLEVLHYPTPGGPPSYARMGEFFVLDGEVTLADPQLSNYNVVPGTSSEDLNRMSGPFVRFVAVSGGINNTPLN